MKMNYPKYLLTCFFSFVCVFTLAQVDLKPTAAQQRLESLQNKKSQIRNSPFANLHLYNIGPTAMSGRVVDIEVNPNNFDEFVVAFASGGLWYTKNGGDKFFPIFDQMHTLTIGDVAVFWQKDKKPIIWVGTGENNSSRSSYAGTGIYKSNNLGESWLFLGLADSHHTGRIVLHPTDPEIAWVAAMGHLYSPNKERGVFKTTNGGVSWEHTLFVNDLTGAIDLVIDPTNPQVLYAATWERIRKAYNFQGAGEGSGIYKSENGGKSWTLISDKKSGLPVGANLGRIGLAISQQNSQVLYVVLDNQNTRPTIEKPKNTLTNQQLAKITNEQFLALDDLVLNDFMTDAGFAGQYPAEKLKEMVRQNQLDPKTLAIYANDAQTKLFQSPVIGAMVYRSDNGGKKWSSTHRNFINKFYYSYGYYFGQIRLNPANHDHVYILGVPILKSTNRGSSWEVIEADNLHVDHHALWINPKDPNHLISGNDGGLNISKDGAQTWKHCNSIPVGQFYTVFADDQDPYFVYGGLQDNGVWLGSRKYNFDDQANNDQNHYKMLVLGDGMQVRVDPQFPEEIYAGIQFGYYAKYDQQGNQKYTIRPLPKLGEPALRFNWQTPFRIHPNEPRSVFMGTNKVMRSDDKGKTFYAISDDLTAADGPAGDVPFHTITTLEVSTINDKIFIAGTDDGKIYLSDNAGNTWNPIHQDLPKGFWVSSIQLSLHNPNEIFVALNGYRNDVFEPMLFRSIDLGKQWKKIGTDLPAEPVNVVKQDPQNQGVLYVGTDGGLYISLDFGKNFFPVDDHYCGAAVHDLFIQKQADELVVATHGRSLFVVYLGFLQQLKADMLNGFKDDLMLFAPQVDNFAHVDTQAHIFKLGFFTNMNAQQAQIWILDQEQHTLDYFTTPFHKGLNMIDWPIFDKLHGQTLFLKVKINSIEKIITFVP